MTEHRVQVAENLAGPSAARLGHLAAHGQDLHAPPMKLKQKPPSILRTGSRIWATTSVASLCWMTWLDYAYRSATRVLVL